MKRIGGVVLATSLLVGVLVFAAPGAANAAPTDGCGYYAVSSPQITGPSTWTGVIYLKYTPPAGQSATVSCELYVNGLSRGIKLGPTSGTGVVVGAGRLTFTAPDNATIGMCMHIVVAGVPQPDICTETPPPSPIPPDEVVELIDTVIGLVESVERLIDPTVCSVLRTAAPIVNAVDPDIVRIDPTQGDVYLLGDLLWDCPPYV